MVVRKWLLWNPPLIEAIKNIAETVAIVVAGGWALWMYVLKERPALKPRASVDVNIGWVNERDRCIASAIFTVKNVGSSDIKVTGATLQAYVVGSEAFPASSMTLVDWKTILASKKEVTELPSVPDIALQHFKETYIGDAAWHDTFEWLVERPRGNSEEWLFVAATVDTADRQTFTADRWDKICGHAPEPSQAPPKP